MMALVTIIALTSSIGLGITFRLLRLAIKRRDALAARGINGDAQEIARGDVEHEVLRVVKQAILTLTLFTLPIQLWYEQPTDGRALLLLVCRNAGVLIVHALMTVTSMRREWRRRRWIMKSATVPSDLVK